MQEFEKNTQIVVDQAKLAHDTLRTLLRAMNKIGLTDEENEIMLKAFNLTSILRDTESLANLIMLGLDEEEEEEAEIEHEEVLTPIEQAEYNMMYENPVTEDTEEDEEDGFYYFA